MEENQKPEMKVVEKKESATPRKLTYEELENVAHQASDQARQLYQQNQQMRQALAQLNVETFYKRLDYMWKIITEDTPYLTEEFKVKCGEEFMEMMKAPEAEETPENTEDKAE